MKKYKRRSKTLKWDNKKTLFVMLLVLLVLAVIIKLLWFSPLSNTKALERTKLNIQNGAYCSGYRNNNADGTRVVVFRDVQTNEVVDSFEVSWSIAEKIYNEEV